LTYGTPVGMYTRPVGTLIVFFDTLGPFLVIFCTLGTPLAFGTHFERTRMRMHHAYAI